MLSAIAKFLTRLTMEIASHAPGNASIGTNALLAALHTTALLKTARAVVQSN